MTRTLASEICKSMPSAEWSDPWGGGHDAWKVGGKMFAVAGVDNAGLSVKTATVEDATLLIDMDRAVRAPYFHRTWVRVDWNAIPEDELRDRIETSYRLIRANLTRKLQASLD